MFYSSHETRLGSITVTESDGALVALGFGDESPASAVLRRETPLIKRTFKQLAEYFAGQRRVFDLPLAPRGTPFQRRVWQALQEIPYGATVSYKAIAVRIGQPGASRAVGMANNRNPIAIIIPCHRVIGADGALVGYGGGVHIKRALLALESTPESVMR